MNGIRQRMEELRVQLEELVARKGTTDDAEVITASKLLDEVMNEYHQELKRQAKIRRQRLGQLLERRSND